MSETEQQSASRTDDNQSKKPVKKASRRRSRWPLFLLLLILVAGGYSWYQLGPGFGLGEGEQAEDQLAEQSRRLDSLSGAQRSLQRDHGSRLDELVDQQRQLADRLESIEQGGRQGWVLAEAEALAALARQRLLLTGDVAAAERLIIAADQLLADLDDPDLIPVRAALARDRERLASAPRVDFEGLALRLSALQQQVPALVLPRRERRLAAADGEVTAADTLDDGVESEPAEQNWLLRWLEHMPLSVRRHEQRPPLPLDDQEQQLVRLSLEMALQEARLALLQGRSEHYRLALSQARILLSEWFVASAEIDGFDNALAALEQEPVARAVPEIGAGHSAIRALRQSENEQ